MAFIFPVTGKTEWSGGSWMPYSQTHRGRTHAAVDIYASRGQTIRSPVSGVVKNFGSGNIGGNWIQVQGDDGNVYYFAHMEKPVTLEKGQKIQGGESIGFVGNSGTAKTSKPHVHFSVKRDGKAISPVAMLQGAVVVPDLEMDKTGVTGGAGDPVGRWDPPNFSGSTSEPLPPQAADEVPAWFDQLREYREDLSLRNQGSEDPVKMRAADVMRGTLQAMAAMVRSAGFQTEGGSDTGIGDPNMIEREAGER